MLRSLTLMLAIAAMLTACGPTKTKTQDGVWTGWPKVEGNEEPKANVPFPKEKVAALFKKVAKQVKAKDLKGAVITLKQITHREPWNMKAHEQYQDLQIQRKAYGAAYQEYYDLLQKHETKGQALWLFARIVLKKRPSTKSQGLTLEEADRNRVANLLTSAGAHIADSDTVGAKKDLQALTKIAPTHIGAHRMLQDLASKSEIPQQVKIYATLLRDHETNGDIVYLYERVASLQEPRDKALVASTIRFMKAVAHDFQGYWLYYGFARSVMDRAAASGDDEEKLALLRLSEGLYRVCTESDELVHEGWHGLGLVQEALENHKAASESLAFALEVAGAGASAELMLSLGRVLEHLNKNEDALKIYRRGQKSYPKDVAFLYNEGRIFFVLGDTKQAVKIFEATYKRLDPKSRFAKQLADTIDRLKSDG